MSTDIQPRLLRQPQALPVEPGPGPGPLEPEDPAITMAAIAPVHGTEPGTAVTVTGSWSPGRPAMRGLSASVTVDGVSFPATMGTGGKWSAVVRFYRAGTVAVIPEIDTSLASFPGDQQNVAVTLNSAAPSLSVQQPTNGSTVQLGEAGTAVALQAHTPADFGPRRMTWSASGPNGASVAGTCDQAQTDPTAFSSTVSLPGVPVPLGTWTVTVRAAAVAPNGAELSPPVAGTTSLSIKTVDATPPQLKVQPEGDQILVVASPTADLPVQVNAFDSQSGVKSVTCSVDNAPATTLLTANGTWAGNIHLTGYGVHVLTFTAVDAAPGRTVGDPAGTTVVTRTVTLRSNYVPATLAERLSAPAYLAALLDFARTRVVLRNDVTPPPHASTTDLEQLSFLHLGDLSQAASTAAPIAQVAVSRLQLAVETVRRFLRPTLVAGRWQFVASGATTPPTVADLSPQKQNLTLGGTAKLGKDPGGRPALVLDPQSFATGPSPTPRIGDNDGDYTVAFWITLGATFNGNWRAVLHRGNSDQERTFSVWLRPNDNGLHVRVSTAGNWNDGLDTTTAQLPLNRPTHVTITKAGSKLTVYFDGKFDSVATLGGPSVANNGPLWVGSSFGLQGFTGSIAALEVLTEAVPDAVAARLGAASWSAPTDATSALAAYGDVAYEALLGGFGLSSADLRLVRGAPADQRAQLATRLGIRLSAAVPDELDQFLLPSGGRTEALLERLFGLPSTDPSLAWPHVPPVCALAQLREQAVSLRWSEQDQALDPATTGFGVIVDPDVITAADLSAAGASSPAGALLTARVKEIAGIASDLHAVRTAQSAPAAAFSALVARALPGVDLSGLANQRASGTDISAKLTAANLTAPAFELLLTTQRLAAAGSVQPDEWADVEALLTRVVTLGRRGAWRAAEAGIALSPTLFVDTGDAPTVIRWRTDLAARAAWLRRLRSRMAELAASHAELGAAISAAQAAALPGLRDSILAGLEGPSAVPAVARWLDIRLGTDVMVGSGSPATTRVESATEFVQWLVSALRGGRVPAWHPARAWRIDDENSFDTGWPWMSDRDGWIAAMLTWLYPENVLAPEFVPQPSPSFAALVQDMRGQTFGVDDARARANQFLGPLRSAVEFNMPTPKARWQLNEGTGASAGDSSGAALNLSGATFGWTQDGLFGAAAVFDGATGWVTVTDQANAALKPVINDFTLSFWVYPTATHEIDSQATSGASGVSGQRFALGPMQAGDRYGDNGAAGAGVSVGVNGISVYEHGNNHMPAVLVWAAPVVGWTHVTVVYTGRVPSLYVNGQLVAKALNPSPKATIYAAPDQIGNTRGGHNPGAAEYGAFQGLITDVRIDAGQLTPTQILQSSFLLTEQRSIADIQRLQAWAPTSPSAVQREVFYLAPVLVASTLARSGEFAAALDWYQSVYSLDLPPGNRAVYPVLKTENNTSVDLTPTADWLTRLNPYQVAAGRPNPYTRATLAGIAQVLQDYGDSEYARGSDTSLANARALYDTAADLLADPALAYVPPPAGAKETTFANPVLMAAQAAIDVRLAKLRQGRDLAGVPRVSTSADSATTLSSGSATGQPSGPVAIKPTPYRYKVLLDRARQLVSLAQQLEGEYLAAMEKYDAAQFRVFDAQKGVDVALQQVQLQDLRLTEADDGVTTAADQKARADYMASAYQSRIAAGLNSYEHEMLRDYANIRTLKDVITGLDTAIGVAQAASSGSGLFDLLFSGGAKGALAIAQSVALVAKGVTTGFLNEAEMQLSSAQLLASHENQVADWKIQVGLAQRDSVLAGDAIRSAMDNQAVVGQEKSIAELQAQQAQATVTFLQRQFTNAELYSWMMGVLGGVYRYFLQLASTTAALAQQQLAFERQDLVPAIVQSDYWQVLPATSSMPGTAPAATPSTSSPDRRGLTGAERLLQDITRLDEYGFETDKRRLNLSQSFSLADRLPAQFYEFRRTGRLSFSTPASWFDESFPGHLLRLIKRVKVSVVGLIPPAVGVRATLTSSGVSRVVLPSGGFPQATLVRGPESVALTSPVSATGVFDLDSQPELLLPFEGSGVDTSWTFDLPRPANPFDFRSLADVVLTVEYTAMSDPDYRDAVLRRLSSGGGASGDRLMSLRSDFVDQFYELNNPDDPTAPRSVELTLAATDFPGGVSDLQVEQLVVTLVPADGATLPGVTLGLQHGGAGGSAPTIDGGVSTRRGNGGAWTAITGSPLGDWTLTLDPAAGALLDAGTVVDILFDVAWSGTGPAWPL